MISESVLKVGGVREGLTGCAHYSWPIFRACPYYTQTVMKVNLQWLIGVLSTILSYFPSTFPPAIIGFGNGKPAPHATQVWSECHLRVPENCKHKNGIRAWAISIPSQNGNLSTSSSSCCLSILSINIKVSDMTFTTYSDSILERIGLGCEKLWLFHDTPHGVGMARLGDHTLLPAAFSCRKNLSRLLPAPIYSIYQHTCWCVYILLRYCLDIISTFFAYYAIYICCGWPSTQIWSEYYLDIIYRLSCDTSLRCPRMVKSALHPHHLGIVRPNIGINLL